MFLIITLCGSIYVRLVFSYFLILPLIKVGVTLENSHINSSLCFRLSSNCSSCLIIFIYLHHPFVWMIFILFIDNKKINQILFSDWFCIYLFNLVRTDTSLVQMAGIEPARIIRPQDFKSCASTSSATSAFALFELDKNYYTITFRTLSIDLKNFSKKLAFFYINYIITLFLSIYFYSNEVLYELFF